MRLAILFAAFLSPLIAFAAPNVVLIMADDLGYGELGCYGQRWIKTPCVDQLAAGGVRFTQFYAGSPVCAPSRCVLLTGKHSARAAIRDNGDPRDSPERARLRAQYGWEFTGQNPLPAEEITLGEVLQSHGYQTAAIGKWGLGHFGTEGDPNSQGFDFFYGFNCQHHAHNHYPRFLWRDGGKELFPGNDRTATGATYSQDRFTEEALAFIDRNQDRPFLLYFAPAIPHLSIQVPEDSLAEFGEGIPEEDYEHKGYLPHPKPRAGYAAMVSHLDRDIGRIVEQLDKLELRENTLVLFTSDNGPTFDRLGGSDSDFFESSAGLRGRKGSVYEGGLRVPLVANWPGQIEAGRESEVVAASWDLFSTICHATGIDAPSRVDGVSLLPALTGDGALAERDALFWEFPGYGGQQAVRAGDWKLVRRGLRRGATTTELYDLVSDPNEQADVADKHPDTVSRLTTLLHQRRTESDRFPIGPAE